MAVKPLHISLEALKELMEYDPDAGVFRWLVRRNSRGGKIAPGVEAGCDNGHGYVRIRISGRRYLRSRLAYYWMTGEWPELVDHINGDKADDRWCNLRLADKSTNAINSNIRVDNTAGAKGVYKTRTGKWAAQIQKNGVNRHLGTFDTMEEAASARAESEVQLFGSFSTLVCRA